MQRSRFLRCRADRRGHAGILGRDGGQGTKPLYLGFHRAGRQDQRLIEGGVLAVFDGAQGGIKGPCGGEHRQCDRGKKGAPPGHAAFSANNVATIWSAIGSAEVAAGEGALQTCRLWRVWTNRKSSIMRPSRPTAWARMPAL